MSNSSSPTWGHDAHPLLTLNAAWSMIAQNVQPLGAEKVPLAQADRRTLAAPVLANDDHPPFDRSLMDGFAVRSVDCRSAGARLSIVGQVAAGDSPTVLLGVGQAMRINTGAPIPAGADAVIRIEETRQKDSHIEILKPAAIGQSIETRGNHRKKGDAILTPPLRLGPAQVAAAAANGTATLAVTRQIDVAIVATGDELVAAGQSRKAGQIYECNGPMLTALLRQFDAVPHDFGIVADEATVLREQLTSALRHPVVITAGGMSLGTLDLVPRVFEELGVQWLFHGVEMRPGKPVAYGRGPIGQHILGLPGNPVSAFVCTWLFGRMIVRGLQGYPIEPPQMIRVALAEDLKLSRDRRPAYIPAIAWHDSNAGLVARTVRWGGSGDPFGLARANALLFRRDPTQLQTAGSPAEIILLSDADLRARAAE